MQRFAVLTNHSRYFKFVRQVATEDFELCEIAQENLERGVYSEGILNPVKENGVAFYQQRVRKAVRECFEQEESEKELKSSISQAVAAPDVPCVEIHVS